MKIMMKIRVMMSMRINTIKTKVSIIIPLLATLHNTFNSML